MDASLQQFSDFFKYCSLINGGLLLFSTIYISLAGDFVYRQQTRFFALPKAQLPVMMYGFLGGYKLLWIVFNVVPFIALQILINR